MSDTSLADTLEKVRVLSEGPLHEAPAPETLAHAAEFISQVHDALAGGAPWAAPGVEVGGGGVVVFLWEDGQRGLSLAVGPGGSGEWVCEPGVPGGAYMSLDVAQRVFSGTAGSLDFARDVLTPWMRAEPPFA